MQNYDFHDEDGEQTSPTLSALGAAVVVFAGVVIGLVIAYLVFIAGAPPAYYPALTP